VRRLLVLALLSALGSIGVASPSRAQATPGYEPLSAPQRLLDTRPGESTVDGRQAGVGKRAAGSSIVVDVAGRAGLGAGLGSVVLNITVDQPDGPGFVTVWPCDRQRPNASNLNHVEDQTVGVAPRPTASNVNYDPGLTTPNAVITRLDGEGDVCIFTLQPVHLVVDVAGTIERPLFEPLAEPRRLLDTRVGESTYDGGYAGGGLQPNGSTLQLDVAGRVGIPADAAALVLAVTSTGSSAPGFVTVHPDGTVRPQSSNVNFTDQRTVANLVVAALGPDGDVCFYDSGTTHLVVDVAGWLTGPPSASPSSPAAPGTPCPGRTPDETADAYRNVVLRRPVLQRVVGTDRIALFVCKIPPDSRVFDGSRQHDATSEDFAALARAQAAPYFDATSGGQYRVEFTALGDITVGPDDGPSECLDEAERRTGAPYTNLLVAGSTYGGGGFASPGRIFTSDLAPNSTVFDRSPAESGRGGWVGGSVISDRPNPATIIHEIGHTIHWPHSYIGPDSEYDNPADVMSGGQGRCRTGTVSYGCDPGNTMAFNRLATGWLRDGQVITHRSGTVNYRLDPADGAGLQLVLLPDPGEPLSMVSIEARTAAATTTSSSGPVLRCTWSTSATCSAG